MGLATRLQSPSSAPGAVAPRILVAFVFVFAVVGYNIILSSNVNIYTANLDEMIFPMSQATASPVFNSSNAVLAQADEIGGIGAFMQGPKSTLEVQGEWESSIPTLVNRNTNLNGITNGDYPDWRASDALLKEIPIRKWGCARTESPLIFVHVGKAGGGMVRARFAASARNYDREAWHAPNNDNHFYPIHHPETGDHIYNASFCNSGNKHSRIPKSPIWPKTFEGNYFCNATTPIGAAIGCPQPSLPERRCKGCGDYSSPNCHQVYVGHNSIGSELHWLPPPFLQQWWSRTKWASAYDIEWDRIHEGGVWCKTNAKKSKTYPRPSLLKPYHDIFAECSAPIGDEVDASFKAFWHATQDNTVWTGKPRSSSNESVGFLLNYSPLYASLPVHRTTLVRDPYVWLISKFFWHLRHRERLPDGSKLTCDNIPEAVRASLSNPGWAYHDVVSYLGYLCGDDCTIRLERGQMSLEEIRLQTIANLKQSFSVVGLLNETKLFYDMVSARIAYVDMTLHPHVQGQTHTSGKSKENRRCKELFSQESFQTELKAQFPLMSVLEEVYNVAVEVNRAQLAELQECPGFGKPKEDL